MSNFISNLLPVALLGAWWLARKLGFGRYMVSNPEALFYLDRPPGRFVSSILAAAEVVDSAERNRLLVGIARQPGLAEAEQEFLLDVLFICDGPREEKAGVIRALIANPGIGSGLLEILPGALLDMDLSPADVSTISNELRMRAMSGAS
jgi:hypothetical protein